MAGREKSISTFLWRNYIFIIGLAIFLILIPCLLMNFTTTYLRGRLASTLYSAEKIMEDNYEEIDISQVVAHMGGAVVVLEDYQVIALGGETSLEAGRLTKKEWADFLVQEERETLGKSYSMAYNDKGAFWLIVEFPISFNFTINVDYNMDSVEYPLVSKIMFCIVGIYLVVLLLGAVLYSKLTSKTFISPIHQLSSEMKCLEEGKSYPKAEKETRIKEFTELERGLAHLSAELEKQQQVRIAMEEKRTQLVRDISHDLKNPLASIQGYAELCLEDTKCTKEELDNYIKIIYNNSLRANELIVSLFIYSKLESSDFTLNLERTDLCEIIRTKLAAFIPIFESKKFSYEVDMPMEELFINVDAKEIGRVVDNLLDNAVKYNEVGVAIKLNVRELAEQVEIHIGDNGIGIPEEMAEGIFSPFTRVDEKVRNSAKGGSGLGLAIVKRVVVLHGGEIKLKTGEQEGCEFIITLPKQNN